MKKKQRKRTKKEEEKTLMRDGGVINDGEGPGVRFKCLLVQNPLLLILGPDNRCTFISFLAGLLLELSQHACFAVHAQTYFFHSPLPLLFLFFWPATFLFLDTSHLGDFKKLPYMAVLEDWIQDRGWGVFML